VTQPGRRSSASLAVVTASGEPERLRPPPELSEIERKIFLELIRSVVFEKGAQGGQPLCPLFPFPFPHTRKGRLASVGR
jgi:hypothetical protein